MKGDRIFSLVLTLLLLLLFVHPIDTDGDFFQHVNIGRYVVTHHALPRADDLTFTAAGRPYVGYAWLSGVLFYFVYKTMGAVAINILVLSIALLTFWLLYRYLRGIGVPHKLSLLTILVIAPVVASRWPTRPEIFMYPIFLGFLLLDEAKRRHFWMIWFYPLLMLLLVNMYGSSFPFAAGLLVLLAVKNWLEGERRAGYYEALTISFPVAVINGYGLKSLLFIFLIPNMTTLWGDWIGLLEILRRPEINYPWEITVMYCLFIAYVVALSIWLKGRLRKLWLFVLLALTVFVPFLAVRMRTLAAIFASPLIGLLLLRSRSRWAGFATLALSLVTIVLCVVFTNLPAFGEHTAVFPPELIRFIKTYDIRGNVFNTPRIGSFLSYYLSPSVRVFSDTRDDLFVNTGVLEAEQAFLSQGASIVYLLAKYHVDFVVVNLADGDSFRDLLYDPSWSLVYFADNYLIFMPRTVAIAKHLSTFDTLDPYGPNGVKRVL